MHYEAIRWPWSSKKTSRRPFNSIKVLITMSLLGMDLMQPKKGQG